VLAFVSNLEKFEEPAEWRLELTQSVAGSPPAAPHRCGRYSPQTWRAKEHAADVSLEPVECAPFRGQLRTRFPFVSTENPASELGNIPFGNNISCLYHVYVSGQAYLAARQGNAATVEFQKRFSTTAALSRTAGREALAHLGVARAHALQSRASQGADADAARVRALAAYKDFLTLWKDADPDIPILKEAKAEYAKLQ
jgi:hypothetical protein